MKDHRVDRAVAVCKKVVSVFSFSWKKRRDLASAQAELGLPSHQLITETPTRWGSRQKMIERVLEQEKAIARVLGSDKKTRQLVPTWQDIDVMESINKAVSPLQEFTDALSGEAYVSVSYLKPVLHLFNSSILRAHDDDTDLTKRIKTTILQYLYCKYSDPVTDELLNIASLMDPRFRTTYIEHDKLEGIKQKVVKELTSLLPDKNLETTVQMTQDVEQEEQRTEAGAKRKKTLASFLKKTAPTASQPVIQSEEDKVKAELTAYLMSPDVDSDTDPLHWWKANETIFPRLSKLAKKHLCIPASSAPSERVFSAGGNIITCHRASLKPETVDRLVFLSRNL